MCLDIDVRYHPNYGKKGSAFIAQQPILVYKRLNNPTKTGGVAPYKGTRWDFGVEQRVPRFGYWTAQRRTIDVGLHAFFTKDASLCYGDVFPAVIPVGASFFLGTDGEVVTTALTVYRTEKDMLAAFGAKAVGPAIRRHTLTKRAR